MERGCGSRQAAWGSFSCWMHVRHSYANLDTGLPLYPAHGALDQDTDLWNEESGTDTSSQCRWVSWTASHNTCIIRQAG